MNIVPIDDKSCWVHQLSALTGVVNKLLIPLSADEVQKINNMINGDNKMISFLDITMLELAETGRSLISNEYLCFYDLNEDIIRQAARVDGVQVRFSYDSNDNLIVTLRKIGLGH